MLRYIPERNIFWHTVKISRWSEPQFLHNQGKVIEKTPTHQIGFIQKPTCEKPVFEFHYSQKPVKPVFEHSQQKNVIKIVNKYFYLF